MQPFVQQHPNSTTTIVPYWVSTAFTRNNLNLIDLFNYDSMRQVLSVEDMAQFICLNPIPCSINKILSEVCLSFFGHSLTERLTTKEQKDDYTNVVRPLAFADVTTQEVVSRLRLFEGDDSLDTTQDYHTVQILSSGEVLIHVKRGIIDALKNSDYAKRFITDCLKAQYTQKPIQEVSSQSAYRLYLEMLFSDVALLNNTKAQ